MKKILFLTILTSSIILGFELAQTKKDLQFYKELSEHYEVSFNNAIETIDKMNQEKINDLKGVK